MTKIEQLAADMGVKASDAQAFVNCLAVWIAKGLTLEQAIAKHMQQMERLASNATHPEMKAFVVECHGDLRAAA